ncbi:hypothetical protein KTT_20160 [Tengunoibacter tsumagoiensis]|uniref:Uncharacterized protein n=1 Tax=Tengunoibacter tsumagoiensis TaxID=2014871 RepID=A0A401ZZ81_9CHLR|nr:hypothetical protein KTT_20160 [Tengunoibacter tsumagoiensis]
MNIIIGSDRAIGIVVGIILAIIIFTLIASLIFYMNRIAQRRKLKK